MNRLKALYLFLALKYSRNNYTVIATPELAARFPTNPYANVFDEADISHRKLAESSYSQVGSTFYGDSTGNSLGKRGVFISDDGLIIAFSSRKICFLLVSEL